MPELAPVINAVSPSSGSLIMVSIHGLKLMSIEGAGDLQKGLHSPAFQLLYGSTRETPVNSDLTLLEIL